ncbi:hypothetical protein D9M69_559680 [compost metagenome]
MAFLEQADLGIDGLVLVALVAAEAFRAVVAVADGGIAEAAFQPVEGLEGHAVAAVRVGAVGIH